MAPLERFLFQQSLRLLPSSLKKLMYQVYRHSLSDQLKALFETHNTNTNYINVLVY